MLVQILENRTIIFNQLVNTYDIEENMTNIIDPASQYILWIIDLTHPNKKLLYVICVQTIIIQVIIDNTNQLNDIE